ncbi:hypothetical protein JQ616_01655 [Bradyrhizobium tropiciagri]|uniref:hypothetical protein n=1 Tax=Bradyrhizobium tropiciagri TaxID=312253 RepID=UPI001BA5CD38|nr:hypothetical protein [Bradyrhizobium tropiciagri]MBR0893639.1 hypothetical protein [Bradyrhizobium tropiciagri]
MPVARYLLYVGGALLALLFLLDVILPNSPLVQRPEAIRPTIRIHSMEKLPDLVVYDTSQPTIVPEQVAEIPIPASDKAAGPSPIVREREAFAQLQPAEIERPKSSVRKTREAKSPRKYAHARRHVPSPYAHFAERRPRYGWFDNYIW